MGIVGSIFLLALVGCSNDEPIAPETNADGGIVSPNENVPDPSGTIELAMRDNANGRTWLDNIYIETENFCGSGDVMFANLGAVRGLGNVATIPTSGWTRKIKVTPGNGYVAYDSHADKFYRIFVSDYILNTAGGIIGADIKYQKPFGGVDEEIDLAETSISFDEEGGSQALFFNNAHIVAFSAESNADWCKVQRATTLDTPFLYNGIVVTVDKQIMDQQQAIVMLTTAYGRKKTVTVSYAGFKPYFTLGDMSELENVPSQGGTYSVGLSTNCIESSEIYSSDSWITTSIINGSAEMHRKAAKLRYIEGSSSTPDQSYNDANDIYTLRISIPENDWGYTRTGNIVVNSPDYQNSYPVNQDMAKFIRPTGSTDVEVESEYTGNMYLQFQSSYGADQLTIDCDFGSEQPWFSVSAYDNWVYLYSFSPNPTENERTAKVIIKSTDGLASLEYTIKQKGIIAYISINDLYDGSYYVSRKAQTYSLKVDTNIGANLSFTSSDTEICTVSYTEGNVILRVKEATENRIATITCSDSRGSFKVHQSKYAVGDTYNEGTVEGCVYHLEHGTGYIYKMLDGTYAWSNENIVTGCDKNGKNNMDIIRSFPDWQTLYPAFAAVDALNSNGATGWYLPAQNHISLIPDKSYKWSSTEYSSGYANYGSGYDLRTGHKSASFSVAAVHEFTY